MINRREGVVELGASVDPPLPRLGLVGDDAAGERGEWPLTVVAEVEPIPVPPLVGQRRPRLDLLLGAVPPELDHVAPDLEGGAGVVALEDGPEEVPKQLDARNHPQERLAERDEGRNLLDSVGVEVMQLHSVVEEERMEEITQRHPQPALVERHERDHIAGGAAAAPPPSPATSTPPPR